MKNKINLKNIYKNLTFQYFEKLFREFDLIKYQKMRCDAKTIKGTQCRKNAIGGSSKCSVHGTSSKSGMKPAKGKKVASSKQKKLTGKTKVVYNQDTSEGAFDYFIVSTWYEGGLLDQNTNDMLATAKSKDKFAAKTIKNMKALGATLIGVRSFETPAVITENFKETSTPLEKKLFTVVEKFRKGKYGESPMALFKLNKKKEIDISTVRDAIDYCATFDTDNIEDRFSYNDKDVAVFFIDAESG